MLFNIQKGIVSLFDENIVAINCKRVMTITISGNNFGIFAGITYN